MKITVNGKPREVESGADAGGISLPEFLHRHDINPRMVAVAINGEVVPKGEYDGARIGDGDAVEIVRMVGGGSA